MRIEPHKAADLLRINGPRYYFQVDSLAGAGINLDHPMWRFPGVRFLVNFDMRGFTPEEFAELVVERIQDFKTNYAAAQPGLAFPGYGMFITALGGAYAYQDFEGLVPFSGMHPDDTLPGFISAFTYTPGVGYPDGPRGGTVTDSGHTPTTTEFKIGSGDQFGRPNGGLVGCAVTFTSGPNQSETRLITDWTGNVATVASAFPSAPVSGNTCVFGSGPLPTCYRFAAARTQLAAWTASFYAELDNLWPVVLPRPEHLVITTENLGHSSTAWRLPEGTFPAYIAAEGVGAPLLTDTLTLAEWLTEFGKDESGTTITLPSTPSALGPRSPEAQDYRSLAEGAFFVGMAWTWQLSFVNRMKQSWPRTRFVHYLLRAGNRASPMRTQPGEVFYHGEPWPPDVAHSPDYYGWILPDTFSAAQPHAATVESGDSESFIVETGSPFLGVSNWGDDRKDLVRFAPETSTDDLQNYLTTITAWNATTRQASIVTLPVDCETGDTLFGYVELDQYIEWNEQDVGWAIWAAYRERYSHTGTLEEIFRATCVSWVIESSQRFAAAWPRHHIVPFISRWAEDKPLNPLYLTDAQMYPDRAITDLPGYQSRDDWVTMLSRAVDLGTYQFVVFEEEAESTDVLDAWLEIFTKTRAAFNKRRFVYEQIAPHLRNREWRKRHLWRG